jgi:glycine cleavage system H protein
MDAESPAPAFERVKALEPVCVVPCCRSLPYPRRKIAMASYLGNIKIRRYELRRYDEMNIVKGLKYSKDHEWLKVEGNTAYLGITNYAQLALGDIVFVELPDVDTPFNAGDVIGVVESVKAVSDIYTPVSGTVVEVNEELADFPEKINEEPYESWIVVIELNDIKELEGLMDEEEYGKYCTEEAEA